MSKAFSISLQEAWRIDIEEALLTLYLLGVENVNEKRRLLASHPD